MSISDALRIGATELKEAYNRNMAIAFGVSIAFHGILIGLYALFVSIGRADSQKTAPVNKINLTNLAPPPAQDNAPPPPPPPMVPPQLQTGGNGGVAARAGTPVAVPDALIDPQMKDFAKMTEVSVATPQGGDGTGFNTPDGITNVKVDGPVSVKETEHVPDPDEFVAVEEDPKWDAADLQRRVKYPEIARKNGIEGTVVVRALVGKDGRVMKTMVDRSDNKALEEAAVDAVTKTPFTPAIQNKQPVTVWVQIPVIFKLS
ncbi:MAG: energy transducer TonB [Bacteroidetes bacterium]|nr:energy transducer TonB [Bacteroidota bacterium]